MTALVVSGAGVAFTAQPLMDRVSEAGDVIRKAAGEATAHDDDARQAAKGCTPQLTTEARPMKADPDALVDHLNDRIEEVDEEWVPEECEPATVYWL